ncbi:hypothetical protein E4U15_002377 [Claviceps sp. LM218 group G6]|nr:hypothetical protein E4U15_002377 [Claviceps sp. LM218 group G6]
MADEEAARQKGLPTGQLAMQVPDEAAFHGTDMPMNDSSHDATGVSDDINGLGTNVFHENPSMTIEETVPEMSPAMQSPHEAAFQAMGTAMDEVSDNAMGVSDEFNQFWRGTFLENPSMTIEQTVPEMIPAMQSPHEAAFQAMSTPMNESSNDAIGVSDGTDQFWKARSSRILR